MNNSEIKFRLEQGFKYAVTDTLDTLPKSTPLASHIDKQSMILVARAFNVQIDWTQEQTKLSNNFGTVVVKGLGEELPTVTFGNNQEEIFDTPVLFENDFSNLVLVTAATICSRIFVYAKRK